MLSWFASTTSTSMLKPSASASWSSLSPGSSSSYGKAPTVASSSFSLLSSSVLDNTAISENQTSSRNKNKIKNKKKKKKQTVPFQPSKREQEKLRMLIQSSTDDTVLEDDNNQDKHKHKHKTVVTERTWHPHHVCECTSAVHIPARQAYMYHPPAWSSLSSAVRNKNKQRFPDVTLQWHEHNGNAEDLITIARRAVELTQPWFDDDDGGTDGDANTNPPRTTAPRFRMLDLVSSMTTFMNYCRTHFPPGQIASYKVKLDVLYGPTATRCPLWHADNVPLRWIQTLTGPGCQYLVEPSSPDDPVEAVPNPFLDRVRYSDHEREGQLYGPHWKETLVRMSSVPVQQAPTGEPILLVGRLWYQHATTRKKKGVHYFHPVLHRSPQNVPHNQGRILINLDVVMKGRRTTISRQNNTHHPAVDRTQCHGNTCAPSPLRDDTSSTMTMMTTTTTTTTIPETKDHTATTKRTPKPSGIEQLGEKYHHHNNNNNNNSKQECDPESCAPATCGCGISPSQPASTTQHQSGHESDTNAQHVRM